MLPFVNQIQKEVIIMLMLVVITLRQTQDKDGKCDKGPESTNTEMKRKKCNIFQQVTFKKQQEYQNQKCDSK